MNFVVTYNVSYFPLNPLIWLVYIIYGPWWEIPLKRSQALARGLDWCDLSCVLLGRKSHGPVRLNGGATYYARLTIPIKLRARAGKTRLIRSLETSNHSEALKRYGTVIAQLEEELKCLLRGESLQQRVDNWNQYETNDVGGYPQTEAEIAEGVLSVSELDPANPLHEEVYNAIRTGKPVAINWDELIEIWIKERNRVKQRNLSPASIAGAREAVKEFRKYTDYPSKVTKQLIRKYMDEHPASPVTVQTRCSYLSALIQCGISIDKLEGINPFSLVQYNAQTKTEDKRKAFSDDQLRELYKENSFLFMLCLTGMRPGEYCSRRSKDLIDNVISVTNEPDIPWTTKNNSSIRRVPRPENFCLMKQSIRIITKMIYLQKEVRKRYSDKRLTPHSGRHTFIELSRRAGCDPRVIDAITGHAKKTTSSTYGDYPDEVLTREIEKVWAYIDGILGKSDTI